MLGSGEMIVVVAVIMMFFGSSQIPKFAKNLGIAQRELKNALSEGAADIEAPPPTAVPGAAIDAASEL